jgi:hypothetical protein
LINDNTNTAIHLWHTKKIYIYVKKKIPNWSVWHNTKYNYKIGNNVYGYNPSKNNQYK